MRKIPFTVVLVAGCASMGGLKSEPLDQGVTRYYEATLADAVRSVRSAVTGAGIAIDEVSQVNESTWMIAGKKSAGAFSWGEIVRVVVQDEGSQGIAVRILTKRRVATNVTATGDWSNQIFSQLDLDLKRKTSN